MAKNKVYVTRMLEASVMELLRQNFDVEVNTEDRPLIRQELLANMQGKDAILCMLNDVIDAEVLNAAGGKCRIIANYAVGYNNIDIAEATRLKIIVTNTPGVLTDATADLAWALLFAAARRVPESDRYTRAGKFQGWAPTLFMGRDVTGKTLGVIGAGRIGQSFAAKSAGFGMKVLYTGNTPKAEFEKACGAAFTNLETLLRESDFVSLHVPLTPSTKYMIGEKELKLMKKTAILINTARGPVVEEAALVRALKEGWIWGAGLDVYENEPFLEPGLAELDNVVLLPHTGSATFETRANMGKIAARNIIAVLQGDRPETCVNPEALS